MKKLINAKLQCLLVIHVEEIIRSQDVNIVARYLAAILEEETAYDIIDEIGRAKSMDDFMEGLRKAMRLSKKIQNEYIGVIPNSDNIKGVVALIGENEENLKFLTRYLASLAFAGWGIERMKKKKEGE